MVNASFIKESPEGVYLAIKLTPRASRNRIGTATGNELKIYVTAPPVDSAANEALVALLAELLDSPKSMVQLTRGHTSRNKIVFVQGKTASETLDRIGKGE